MSDKNYDFTVGQEIELNIEKIVFGGEGLATLNNFVFFVPMSVPGDKVIAKIISLKKTYGRALISKILTPSKDRIEDTSKISFEDFDGCDFAMLNYEKQLYYKDKMLLDVVSNIAKLKDVETIYEKIIPAKNIKNYRNKTAEPFFKIDGEIKTGLFSKKSHDVFLANEPLLRSKIASEIISEILEKINNENIFTVFSEKENKGFLKHLIIRNNEKNEVMIIVVVNKKSQIRELQKVLEEIYYENDFVKSIYISIKEKRNNVILGEKNIKIIGNDCIEESINDIMFKIYPDSFFQINKEQAILLYDTATKYLGSYKDKTLIDAFCGTGTISMVLSKNSKKVIGIESSKSSVVSANETSKENNIKNVQFLNGKVEDKISEVLSKNEVDYIVFDPPRKGISEEVLKSVVENKINKMVYISCEPSTFARDVKYLCEKGYTLEKLGSVDMFPQTHHIECIGLLKKLGGTKI